MFAGCKLWASWPPLPLQGDLVHSGAQEEAQGLMGQSALLAAMAYLQHEDNAAAIMAAAVAQLVRNGGPSALQQLGCIQLCPLSCRHVVPLPLAGCFWTAVFGQQRCARSDMRAQRAC